jgi:hypothetical protein
MGDSALTSEKGQVNSVFGAPTMRLITATAMFALVAASGAARPASAAVITRTFDFTAFNFVALGPFPAVPPYTSVTGSFTVTFDDAVSVSLRTNGVVLNSLSIPITGLSRYSFQPGAPLIFDTIGPNGLFFIAINNAASNSPTFVNAAYALSGNPNFYNGFSGRVALAAPGVPEPSGWLMMILGMGLAGVSSRRRSAARMGAAT